TPLPVERSIFFANIANAHPDVRVGSRVHYRLQENAAVGIAPILPGRFAVMAPTGYEVVQGGDTYQVSVFSILRDERPDFFRVETSESRRLELLPSNDPTRNGVRMQFNYLGDQSQLFTDERPSAPGNPGSPITQPAVAVVIDAEAKSDSLDRVYGSPLSVTDPLLDTYDERASERGASIGRSNDPNETYNQTLDIPLDDPDQIAGDQFEYDGEFDGQSNDPDFKYPIPLRTLGSTVNYRKIHLQRLANPLIPFNRITNPYRTIDSSWIDLTVYNGLAPLDSALQYDGEMYRDSNCPEEGWEKRPGVQNPWHPANSGSNPNQPYVYKKLKVRFRTRQRGDDTPVSANNNAPPFLARRLWRQSAPAQPLSDDRNVLELSEQEADIESGRQNRQNFNFVLSHSLGFANSGKWPPFSAAENFTDERHPGWGDQWIAGGLGNPYGGFPDTQDDMNNPVGNDHPPFPWLVWNNRTYANAMELLQVPYTSSATLLQEFSFPNPHPDIQLPPELDFQHVNSTQGRAFPNSAAGPFGHLLNFAAQSVNGNYGNPPTNQIIRSPELSRLFDVVEVPSPFEGTARWYANTTREYQLPFSRLSRFRNPGLVNINTVTDPRVWSALLAANPAAPAWDALVQSRRGYGPITPLPQGPLAMDATFPTRFAAPFRAASSADLAPNIWMDANSNGQQEPDEFGLRQTPIQAGLLRPIRDGRPPTDFENQTLFLEPRRMENPNNANDPFGVNAVFNVAHNDADRNPYFRYYNMQRLGGTVTTHSNCFAVWVTVGYFEALPWKVTNGVYDPSRGFLTYDVAHPDGYTLGQEIGSDTGDIQRHRAFYIIDRSLPVGYEPGNDLNAWDAVTLRRVIE
ncbi:MAG TPA: hypothetical protein VIY86_04500, partial [Pirellulaceae bacterium]